MEMERINDNTIRVMVENEDLKERGTSIRDLLSDRNKIESFFYNILSELDTDDDFVDNDKVSFQVLPNQNGLELFISRLDEEGALGDLLASLSEREDDQNQGEMPAMDDLSLEQKTALQGSDGGEVTNEKPMSGRMDTVVLDNFENLLALVALLEDFQGHSSAYRYNGAYYLVLDSRFLDMTAAELNAMYATLIEYGRFAKQGATYLSEHGDVLFEEGAIQSLNKIFASAE
ncbi:adaptor protein MecA [Fructobacillus sp. M2-14]|uniref:Adaptor protein MecA n=1 Tax=Fructobacillus broussonetiae TaxID=2713173 RepID=A0ABS5R1B8_9LACO|nr:adaptor protein MecA [Fructobacillus broussonetiae]MBS9338309.1 adaptor protein MecA [Fructobacillus broussonetiae]